MITDRRGDGFYLSHNLLKIKSSTEALRRNSFMWWSWTNNYSSSDARCIFLYGDKMLAFFPSPWGCEISNIVSAISYLLAWKECSLKILKILILIGSFLASVHKKSSLAAAITYYFEKQTKDVPEGQTIRATASLEEIRGVLQACEDQTSAIDWQNCLLAVGATLGMSEIKA